MIALRVVWPTVIFTVIYALLCMPTHKELPGVCAAVTLLGLFVVAWRACSVLFVPKDSDVREIMWLRLSFGLSLLAWILAVVLGLRNWSINMGPWWTYTSLNTYVDVDPANVMGQSLMDAGRILFTPDVQVHVDLQRASSFKDQDTYCAAPIVTKASSGGGGAAETYDLWVAGVNCCSGLGSTQKVFTCGGSMDNPSQKLSLVGALRQLDEDGPRRGFRLAVQQAEVAYGIEARHPIFLTLEQDPVKQVQAYWDAGIHYLRVGILGHFLLQAFLIAAAVISIERKRFGGFSDDVAAAGVA